MKSSKGFAALQKLKTEMEIERKEEELHWHDEMNKRYKDTDVSGFLMDDEQKCLLYCSVEE